MNKVVEWPIETEPPPLPDAPRPIMRPCDYGLQLAIINLETQCGSIEAYMRICRAAASLKAKIDGGKAEPQNPCYATDASGRTQRP
jgi:hypothetical protein